MSRSHIAYGPKDAIGKVIAGRHIPTNCLVITKVADPAEEAELLYFDKDYTPHQISMRHVFPSMEVATEWIGRYYCVGRHIVVKDGDEWHSYIVGDDNELIVADGTDKVSIVTAGDASVVVNGETMTPTISVNLDQEFANGLSISEDGLMLNVATDSKAGAMSAADKFKLDEIEAGAQVNTITDIGTGSANGTISVNGVDITVKGLGSAAFTDSDAYTPAGVGMSYMIVEELPDDGAVGVIYLVPNEGAGDNVYDEFLYVNDEPELIGTTETDLSDYYTKNEVVNVIRSEVDDAITGKVDTISLARVATTGSFNDLNDKPGIPIVLDVAKRSDGLYYPSITYTQGIAILESGGQISIHWPENNLVYQCKQWRSTSSSIFFGTQDENTYRVLRWNSHTGTVEPFSNNTFATSANLSDKVDKVSGKGLSTNDYTNAEKSKLAGFGDASLYALKSEVNVEGKVDKIPGKGLSTNDFTNEEKNKLAGFGDANIYALKEDLNSIYRYKGSVATESALPNSGTNVAGDVYNVEENGMNYAWNGTSWDALGADPEEPIEVDPISNSSIDGIIGPNSSSTDPSDAMQTVETDRSLSHDGVPADAKATGDAIAAEASARQTQISALQNAVGSPLVANTAAGMTSTDKIYVYTGSETGYTAGHWYYHNGSAWTDGGVYNSTAFNTDTTLSVAGMAADAEATGDEISDLKSALGDDLLTEEISVDLSTISGHAQSTSIVGDTLTLLNNDPWNYWIINTSSVTDKSFDIYTRVASNSCIAYCFTDENDKILLRDDISEHPSSPNFHTFSNVQVPTLAKKLYVFSYNNSLNVWVKCKKYIPISDSISTLIQDVDNCSSQIYNLIETKERTTQPSLNIFDEDLLKSLGFVKTGNGDDSQYTGKLALVAGGRIIFEDFSPEKVYTVSFEGYTDAESISTGNGLYVGIEYTDGTRIAIYQLNSVSSWEQKSFTTVVGKNASKLIIGAGSGSSGNTWHIRKLQVTETNYICDYIPSESARDTVLENKVYSDITFPFALNWWNNGRIRMIMHGGMTSDSQRVMNCAASYRTAGINKAWSVECDIRVTADGKYICYHDSTLDAHSTGTGSVADKTFAEIRALFCTDPVTGEVTDQIIPTFEECLQICKTYQCIPCLDWKINPSIEQLNEVIGILEDYGFFKNYMFTSPVARSAKIRNITDIPVFTSVTTLAELSDLVEYVQTCNVKNWGVELDATLGNDITHDIVKQIHDAGMFCGVWSANTESNVKSWFELGMDVVTSDRIADLTT